MFSECPTVSKSFVISNYLFCFLFLIHVPNLNPKFIVGINIVVFFLPIGLKYSEGDE